MAEQTAHNNTTVTDAAAVCFLQHCTPLYVSTVIARSGLGVLCYSTAEVAEACLLASATYANHAQLAATVLGNGLALTKYPAWAAGKRPPSVMQHLQVPLQMELQDLQGPVESFLATSTLQTLEYTPLSWKGVAFQPALHVYKSSGKFCTPGEPCLSLWLFLTPANLLPGLMSTVTCHLMLHSAAAARGRNAFGIPSSYGISDVATLLVPARPGSARAVRMSCH
jgi:hypothetical protein